MKPRNSKSIRAYNHIHGQNRNTSKPYLEGVDNGFHFIHERLLRLNEVQQLSGLSRSTLERKEQQGTFPARVRLSRRCVGWKLTEISKWIETLREASNESL